MAQTDRWWSGMGNRGQSRRSESNHILDIPAARGESRQTRISHSIPATLSAPHGNRPRKTEASGNPVAGATDRERDGR
jgi:hypothetical protein